MTSSTHFHPLSTCLVSVYQKILCAQRLPSDILGWCREQPQYRAASRCTSHNAESTRCQVWRVLSRADTMIGSMPSGTELWLVDQGQKGVSVTARGKRWIGGTRHCWCLGLGMGMVPWPEGDGTAMKTLIVGVSPVWQWGPTEVDSFFLFLAG